ncbi:spore germination protein [Paenibacillus sp. N4]|uniref:GerAB/ArcD/ProY family transporter n=1 Tax=Paenibacillus vietnamensis TaxID=2590547 RepID=UPI001CD0967C|nr:GerAB/ArcD/ProY family transporter [Paenibacillus vietnamensis]MCA0757635.1 spore germination protein [Paenibacillus vietnamensis]
MERISKHQLAAMIILFQIGSTPLFEIGIRTGQNAWIVVICNMLLGCLLLLMFLAIHRKEPDKNLNELFIHYFGTVAGKALALFYVLLFIYESMRNLRDFGDLTVLTILPRTPISLIMLVMVALSVYALKKGIEIFFRLAEFIVAGVLFFYLILIAMTFVSGLVHWKRLLPVMENGVRPILLESSESLWFPFGQMMIFLIFWKYAADKAGVSKASLRAYFTAGFVILITSVINISVLGHQFTDISTVPLLQTVQLIQIADVFERFDTLVIMLFYAGIYMKATLWLLAAVLGLSQIFPVGYRTFLLPVGGVIYATAFLPPSWQAHLEFGETVATRFMMNPIFLGIIPAVLYAVMLLKIRFPPRRRYANPRP